MASADEVVAHAKRTLGAGLTLGHALSGGQQQGAWFARSTGGADVVLKWHEGGVGAHWVQIPEWIRRIRQVGYPTPAWWCAGVTETGVAYQVQDFVRGSRATWQPSVVRQILATIELQRGQAPRTDRNWSTYIDRVTNGKSDVATQVHHLGPRGSRLVAHCEALVAGHLGEPLPGDDFVHGDLNTTNVLVLGGQIAGVVDTDAVGRGTRAVDYAWLLREAHTESAPASVTSLIRQTAEQAVGTGPLARCAAATVIDIVAFMIRRGGDLPRGYLDRLHTMLDDLEG